MNNFLLIMILTFWGLEFEKMCKIHLEKLEKMCFFSFERVFSAKINVFLKLK